MELQRQLQTMESRAKKANYEIDELCEQLEQLFMRALKTWSMEMNLQVNKKHCHPIP
jgi:hypothetical protein